MKVQSGYGCTRADVVRELSIEPGVWKLARDLQSEQMGNSGLRFTIQSISNALRHAYTDGLVERRHVSGDTSEWRVKL